MKAQILHGIGDIRYEETDKPRIEKGWVLVKVKAAGVCGSDIPRIYKTGAHVHPIVTGHEFSGEVIETADDNSSWRGKRVGIFPLIPCGECISCKKRCMKCAVIIIILVQGVTVVLLNMQLYQNGILLNLRIMYLTSRLQ